MLDEICRDKAVGGGRLVFVEHLLDIAADQRFIRLLVRGRGVCREARKCGNCQGAHSGLLKVLHSYTMHNIAMRQAACSYVERGD